MDGISNDSSNGSTDGSNEEAIVNLFNYIVYSLIILVGVPGNVLLVWCLVSVRREQVNKSYKILVINLAVDDILLLLFCLFTLAELKAGYFIFGTEMCYIIYPVQTAFYGVGVFNMVALNVHRYYIITFPVSDRRVDKFTVVIVVLCWLIPSLITALPYALNVHLTEDNQCDESWSTRSKKTYTVYLLMIQYILPLVVIATLNALTIRRLKRGEMFRANCARMSSSSLHAHRRIVKMLIFIVLIFALFGLPGQIIWLIPVFNMPLTNHYFSLIDVFPFMYCVLNPVLFFAYNKECHDMLRKLLMTFFFCCDNKWQGKRRHNSQNGTCITEHNFSLLNQSRISDSQETNEVMPKSDLFAPAIPKYILDEQSKEKEERKTCTKGLVTNTVLLSSLKNLYSCDVNVAGVADRMESPLINDGTNVNQQLFRGSFVELLTTHHINNDLMRRLEASPETAIIEEDEPVSNDEKNIEKTNNNDYAV